MLDVKAPAGLTYKHLYTAHVELDPPIQLGDTGMGQRVIIPITGGCVDGGEISGRILPGADWILVRPDGVGELDIRARIETDDGAQIYVTMRGIMTNVPSVMGRLLNGESVSSDEYYLAFQPKYETSDPRYSWINQRVAVAQGEAHGDHVIYSAYVIE